MKKLCHIRYMSLVVLAAVGVFCTSGYAAMRASSMTQLVKDADAIVLGTVVDQVSFWNAQHTAIYTDVTVAVEKPIAGASGANVTFRVAGGIVGPIGMRTSNDPEFRLGERIVVFLRTAGAITHVVGRAQGKYAVRDGRVLQHGRAIAVADFLQAIRAASSAQ